MGSRATTRPRVLPVPAVAPAPDALPRRWTHAALVLALAIPILAIFLFGAAHSATWVPCCLGLYAATALLLCAAAARGWPLPLPRLLLPMGGFGALVCYQFFLHHTASPSDSLTALMQLAAAGCLFYLAAVGLTSWRRLLRAGLVLWITGGALAIEAIAQFFTANQQIYWFRDASYATPVGPFYYHNHFAGCMDLLIPIGLGYSFCRSQPGAQTWILWVRRGLLPALAVAAAVLADSRGGLLTLAVEGLVFLVLSWKRLRRGGWLAIGATALLLAAAATLTTWRPLVNRLGMLKDKDPSAVYRLEVTAACWHMFRDHLWTGIGFGSFPSVYPRYQTFDSGTVWQHAHDEYAQALAETGLVGAGAILVFMALWVGDGRRLQAPELSSAQRVQLGAFVGAAGLLFHSLGDFQFHSPANLWLFFLAVALSAAAPPPARRRHRLAIPARA